MLSDAGPQPRIAILHYAAPPIIGGVESTIAMHARLFHAHDYPIQIIAGRGESFHPDIPVEIIADVDSRTPRVSEVNAELTRGQVTEHFHALVRDLTDILKKSLADCNILIVHNALTLHKNLALTAALKNIAAARKPKLIAWCHDFAWDDPVYAGALHAGLPWDLLKQPWDGVRYVVVSESRKKDLQRLWGTDRIDIAVIPPGINALEFFGVSDAAAKWTRDLHLLDAAPLLLLPARVTRRKNIELAIEITAELRACGLTPKLIVMGPLGPHNPANIAYLDELRTLRHARCIDEAVIFLQELGKVDDAARRDLYVLADALLFPSEREGFGIPILEAGLGRLPIFCSDIPPFRESAQDTANYFSLNESPSRIAARLAEFFANDPRYRLKQRVLHEYTWEQIFRERIEPLLKEPINGD